MSSKPKKPALPTDEIGMDEAREITGLSRATIYNRIKSGELKKIQTVTAHKKAPVKFHRADVLALLNPPESTSAK
jgi:hypothetical protein